MNWTVYLGQALVQPTAWSRLVRVVQSNAVLLIQRECVVAVLNHHKNKAAAMPASQRKASVEALARAMRRRAAECGICWSWSGRTTAAGYAKASRRRRSSGR